MIQLGSRFSFPTMFVRKEESGPFLFFFILCNLGAKLDKYSKHLIYKMFDAFSQFKVRKIG